MGKLGQLLVARSWITVQQLTRALQNQHAVGGRLGTCLLEMEALGEDLLARSLSEQLGVPAAAIEDLRGIPDEVLHLIPEKLARRCRAIPFRVAGGRLDVAMQDPRNLVCQDEIAFACGRRVKVHVLHELRIYEALQRYYREECPSRYSLLIDRLNRARYLWGGGDATLSLTRGQGTAGQAPAAAGGRRAPGDDVTEVLSALPADGLLDVPRRMTPPPLPEPATPPSPRKRSLFRSQQQQVPPPPAAPGARSDTAAAAAPPARQGPPAAPPPPAAAAPPALPANDALLPPLAEVDLRSTPRRLRVLEAATATLRKPPPTGEIPTLPAAAGPAGDETARAGERAAAPPPTRPGPEEARVSPDARVPATARVPPDGTTPQQPAAPPTAPQPAARPARPAQPAAAAPAGGRRAGRAPDLETTMVLRPPVLTSPAAPSPPDAGAAPGSPPSRRVAASSTQPAPADGPVAVPEPRRKVELTAAERVELGLGGAQPAAPAAPLRDAPSSLEEVEAAFARTTDLAEVGRILLGFLGHSYRRVALFQVSRQKVTAWMAHGEGIDQEAFGRYSATFSEPSVFLNLQQGSGIHLGPLPAMQAHRELALCWGGGLPRDCVVLPVRLKDRLVTAIYADGSSRGLWGIDLDQMQRLMAATATAFERCIVSKKRGYAQS